MDVYILHSYYRQVHVCYIRLLNEAEANETTCSNNSLEHLVSQVFSGWVAHTHVYTHIHTLFPDRWINSVM